MGYGLYLAIHVDDVSLALLGFVRESASLIDIVASALALDITYSVGIHHLAVHFHRGFILGHHQSVALTQDDVVTAAGVGE